MYIAVWKKPKFEATVMMFTHYVPQIHLIILILWEGVRDADAKKFSRWRRMTGVFCQISLIIPDKFTSPVSITVVSV